MSKPKLLMGIETLLHGGAESFVVRLANALSEQLDVMVFVVCGNKIDERLLHKQKNNFKLESFNLPFEFLLYKLDRILFLARIDFSFRNFLTGNRLKRLIKREHFHILHSHQFNVDHLFSKVNRSFKIRHLTTIHGDYINFMNRLQHGNLQILDFEKKVKSVLTSLDEIVYISDHQFSFFRDYFPMAYLEEKFHKIYNGIELPISSPGSHEASPTSFTFGMVARGIREKGWEISVQSFLSLNLSNAQLILVGESSFLNELRKKYTDARIIFVGYSVNPKEWIEKFDVGLLPTTFPSESLPTSIIEYLAMGKPVIASDVGEIKKMLIQDGRSAGIVLQVIDGKIDGNQLTDSMKSLALNRSFYKSLKSETYSCSKIFDIHQCARLYLNLYNLKYK